MKITLLRALAIVVVLTPIVVSSQESKSKPTTATYITKEEVDAVNSTPGVDREIKVVTSVTRIMLSALSTAARQ